VEVEGFPWTCRLLDNIEEFSIPPICPADPARPRYAPAPDKMAAYMLGGIGPNPLRIPGQPKPMNLVNPDLSDWYNRNLEWIDSVLRPAQSCLEGPSC
jgi:hypothetical protein